GAIYHMDSRSLWDAFRIVGSGTPNHEFNIWSSRFYVVGPSAAASGTPQTRSVAVQRGTVRLFNCELYSQSLSGATTVTYAVHVDGSSGRVEMKGCHCFTDNAAGAE